MARALKVGAMVLVIGIVVAFRLFRFWLRMQEDSPVIITLDLQRDASSILREIDPDRIDAFWVDFQQIIPVVQSAAAGKDAGELEKITKLVHGLCDGLEWECGPDESRKIFFAVSPDADRSLMPVAQRVADRAPTFSEVTIRSGRPAWHAEMRQLTLKEAGGESDLTRGMEEIQCRNSENGPADRALILSHPDLLSGANSLNLAMKFAIGAMGEEELLKKFTAFGVEPEAGEGAFPLNELASRAQALPDIPLDE
ncbi:hypothetical protein HZA57_05035 [Candidatus Poribacteria bacterium]|nr:hypothetical protein [Candidatus Poribacteria bacterium]